MYKAIAKYFIRMAFVTFRNGPIAKVKTRQLFNCCCLYFEIFLTLENLINCSDLMATSAKSGRRKWTIATNIPLKKIPAIKIGSGTIPPNLTSIHPVVMHMNNVTSKENGRTMNAMWFVGVSRTWSCRYFIKSVRKGVNFIIQIFGKATKKFERFLVMVNKQRKNDNATLVPFMTQE